MKVKYLLILTILKLTLCSTVYAKSDAVVLMYHRFGETTYPSTNIKIDQFQQHLDHLEQGGFNVLSLDKIISSFKNGDELPDKVVAITIDDAYSSVYESAYPMLKEKGFPFTVFVATNTVDKPGSAYMTWSQIREMHEDGVVFANHSLNHDYLVRKKNEETDDQWRERITEDIRETQNRLVKKLGSAPMLLAYPYGEYNSQILKIVEELGFSAFGQQSGAIGVNSDFRALPRYPMNEHYAGMDAFKLKVASRALPVEKVEPIDPVTSLSQPELTITLIESDADLSQLACYFQSERLEVNWLIPDKKFNVQTKGKLPQGRSRYNCTAPGTDGRYYWFSHLWITGGDN